MCNFIKSNVEQCKLARNKERCGKHAIIIDREEIIVGETNIIEEMSPQPNTPAIADAARTPAPLAIKPVEVSNIDVSKVPELDESIIAPFFFEQYIETGKVKQFDVNDTFLDPMDVIGAFNEYNASKNLDIKGSEMIDSNAYFGGYRYCFYIQKGNKTLRHFYCKSEQMMINIPIMIDELNVAQNCVSKKIYDHRLYDLCCLMKWSWFYDNNNTWNLASMLYKKQHVDLGLIRKTYLCTLQTMTDRFDQAAALRVFNDWETCKYHPKLTEFYIKSIADAANPIEYNKWKAEYEPKEIKEKKEKKYKKGDDLTVPHFPKFHIYYKKGELPPIFDCKNTETLSRTTLLTSCKAEMETT
ncbi:uncharacterized protein PITG_21943 [Phytophthora infestans T30-4]|uniref:Uncharacterized protein n=1 Tax=Phytophthora infestans (strain T30-4) TaxID=403677 RepID=D0P0U0_PHYIT|nr:uncharacterized protein PITG_19491 [Phytophthora infestans T30-4]XP_002999338.1 uncharacterized protein PITG_21943 [Phytophthora infestans T30-4]EEY53059.1 conserved hypothetical protein [Phytophthora infestans T30-4]EEY67973.1 conserved hypothetical protein [Phytophthora infestans T30-4]|eukprot:XP_002896084.1 conserved hypothetical protein [Phytophthora infestans T30-4]